jgi:hypothetical protein
MLSNCFPMNIEQKKTFLDRFEATKDRPRKFQLTVVILIALFLIILMTAMALKYFFT